MSETVIEFKDVDMSFGDKTVLDHVSFSVEKERPLLLSVRAVRAKVRP
ncbi:hypothetical protein M5E89_11525 [Acidaminococcus intestini]|nr:hypothetical protein M5E89_11525 [Acidaminococcus intestini]